YIEDKDFQLQTHEEVIELLKDLRFPISEDIEFVTGKNLEKTIEKFRKKKDSLSFPIDGLVIKLNDLKLREELGATSHSPRWARALKFEALMKESKIINIEVTTGRTGKITPRAEIEPIKLAGTTVRYATLHNQDYIDELGIGIGAIVMVAKRGEIIPAVEEVVTPPEKVYKIPETCTSCGTKLVKIEDSVDFFCLNQNCPARILARLIFFCQKKQMDIEGLGEKQIETFYKLGYIKNIPDIYKLHQYKEEIQKLEGFGEKSVRIILNGIEKSKSKNLKTLLPALGFSEIGHKVTEILIENGYTTIDSLIRIAQSPNARESLISIHGLGEKTVEAILETFRNPENLQLIQELKLLGLNFTYQTLNLNQPKIFEGETWCVTGSFQNFQPRDKAMDLVVLFGGKKVSSVSKATTHLLAGEGAGSKLEKAKKLGVKIITEQEFLERLPKNYKEYL
ncbi:MAG: NAD-dependent DNA ligase LigA, partial [Leptospiraceae bacterium]|nr:NAD-dependent DNA ligase LigA [Leptospiraceae bacterium]